MGVFVCIYICKEWISKSQQEKFSILKKMASYFFAFCLLMNKTMAWSWCIWEFAKCYYVKFSLIAMKKAIKNNYIYQTLLSPEAGLWGLQFLSLILFAIYSLPYVSTYIYVYIHTPKLSFLFIVFNYEISVKKIHKINLDVNLNRLTCSF